MNQVLASLLVAAAIAVGVGAPDQTAEPNTSLTMEELLSSPTVFTGSCADCDECQGNKREARMTDGQGSWTTQVCDFGSACMVPCLYEEEEEQEEQVMLTPEQQTEVSDRLLSKDPEAGWEVLQAFPKAIDFVAERGSIQLHGCDRAIVANLPLTDAQIDYILAQ